MKQLIADEEKVLFSLASFEAKTIMLERAVK